MEVLGAKLFSAIAGGGFSKNAKENTKQLEDRILLSSTMYFNLVSDSEDDRKKLQIYGTLETLVSLIRFCKRFRPQTYSARVGNESQAEHELIPRRRYRLELEHFPFCELCYKLCEAEDLRVIISSKSATIVKFSGNKIEPEYEGKKGPSSRFCKAHRPGSTAYRRDHNCHEAFQKKIKELRYALGHKTYTKGIDELKKLLEEEFYFDKDFENKIYASAARKNDKGERIGEVETEIIIEMIEKGEALESHLKNYHCLYSELDAFIRYVAYNIVRPKGGGTQQKTPSRGKGVTLKALQSLLAQGYNQKQAAEKIGISRQAAGKVLNNAKKKTIENVRNT